MIGDNIIYNCPLTCYGFREIIEALTLISTHEPFGLIAASVNRMKIRKKEIE